MGQCRILTFEKGDAAPLFLFCLFNVSQKIVKKNQVAGVGWIKEELNRVNDLVGERYSSLIRRISYHNRDVATVESLAIEM